MPTNQRTGTDSVARQYLYDVFLSHHSSDKPLVEMIAARLEDEAGLKPFLDKWHLVPGEAWEEELEEALDKSATCAVFLGPSALGAWHNEEMRAALDERVRNKSFRVVPILLPGAEPKDKDTLPRFLRRLTWVDFRAGLDDQEAFHRLVAGIKGLPPGRQVSSLNSAPSPSQSLNRVSVSGECEPRQGGLKEKKPRAEMWKIVAGAILALLLSTSFIGAAIPRYKLQIKSPAFKKEGVYEAPEGTVTVKWAMLKEQWFREVDVGAVKANATIRRLGDENEESFPNAMGEVNTKLRQGKYEVRIDAVEHQRSETIALEISALSVGSDSSTYFRGSIEDKSGNPIDGAEVELTEILDQPVLKTTTTNTGGFNISNIPARVGERVRVIVRVKGVEKHNQYWTLPGPHKIKLEK